ncbi:hypothetical protein CEXT_49331 [Caerostris extrusa]|uniref:Uncharacterized protein n=1 Tax=Caerostris extrusa TaxID=172846 RepID=A0AAV4XQ87_CAEEX|nr:hypothetical protein CEXT_49331 [Caerostris extrusa]
MCRDIIQTSRSKSKPVWCEYVFTIPYKEAGVEKAETVPFRFLQKMFAPSQHRWTRVTKRQVRREKKKSLFVKKESSDGLCRKKSFTCKKSDLKLQFNSVLIKSLPSFTFRRTISVFSFSPPQKI